MRHRASTAQATDAELGISPALTDFGFRNYPGLNRDWTSGDGLKVEIAGRFYSSYTVHLPVGSWTGGFIFSLVVHLP